jgi:hypothetical protein
MLALAIVSSPFVAHAADSPIQLCRDLGPDPCAERITRLAEGSEPASALAGLRQATAILEGQTVRALVVAPSAPQSPGSSPQSSRAATAAMTVAPAPALPATDSLQMSVYERRGRISAAALAWYSRSSHLDEPMARAALDSYLAANDCRRDNCESIARVVGAVDRLSPNLAYEAGIIIGTGPAAQYAALRRRQFAILFGSAGVMLVLALMFAARRRWPRTLAALVIVAGALAVGAAMQFLEAGLLGPAGWIAPRLWLATLTGDLTLTLIIAAALAVKSDQWLVRAAMALVSAEIAWWAIPVIFATFGIALRMPHYSAGEDFTPLIGLIAGAIFAPPLAWAIAAVAARAQGRLAPD